MVNLSNICFLGPYWVPIVAHCTFVILNSDPARSYFPLKQPCFDYSWFPLNQEYGSSNNIFQEQRFNRTTYIRSIYIFHPNIFNNFLVVCICETQWPPWLGKLFTKTEKGKYFCFLTLVPLTSCWRRETLRQYASLTSFISSKSIQMSQSRNG